MIRDKFKAVLKTILLDLIVPFVLIFLIGLIYVYVNNLLNFNFKLLETAIMIGLSFGLIRSVIIFTRKIKLIVVYKPMTAEIENKLVLFKEEMRRLLDINDYKDVYFSDSQVMSLPENNFKPLIDFEVLNQLPDELQRQINNIWENLP